MVIHGIICLVLFCAGCLAHPLQDDRGVDGVIIVPDTKRRKVSVGSKLSVDKVRQDEHESAIHPVCSVCSCDVSLITDNGYGFTKSFKETESCTACTTKNGKCKIDAMFRCARSQPQVALSRGAVRSWGVCEM